MMPIIDVKDLQFYRPSSAGGRGVNGDKRLIIDNMTFQLAPGERLGLIGMNGAGKSTLLRLIGGILQPHGGKVTTRGEVGTLFSVGVGMNDEASGFENIQLALTLLGVSRRMFSEISSEISRFTELGDRLREPVRTYSTGMRTRLAFAITTSIKPDILLIDEVIGAGDVVFQKKARDRINNLISGSGAAIIASHSPTILKELCTHVAWINDGQIVEFGNPESVLAIYSTAAFETVGKPISRTIQQATDATRYKCPPIVSIEDMDEDSMSEVHTRFPAGYLTGFVEWMSKSEVSVITYNDLAFQPRADQVAEEFSQWYSSEGQSGRRSVLIQYDIDDNIAAMENIVRKHIELGLPANVMVFAKKSLSDFLDDKEWKIDNSYKLDFQLLRDFQDIGGVVGYHSNAFERANANVDLALKYFKEDILELRKHLAIKHFSMHGGFVDATGMSNSSLPVKRIAEDLGLVWVHNGESVFFTRTWADGGAGGDGYKNESSDPLLFVATTKNRERTRLLFHPQYYCGDDAGGINVKAIQDMRWVKEINQRSIADWCPFWSEKSERLDTIATEKDLTSDTVADPSPLFMNGQFHSGVDLLAAMVGADESILMASRFTPNNLLADLGGKVISREEYIYSVQCLQNYSEARAIELLVANGLSRIAKFVVEMRYIGLDCNEIAEYLIAFLFKENGLYNFIDAAKFLGRLVGSEQKRRGGTQWGAVIDGNYEEYTNIWPDCRIVYVMRDGLDVLAQHKVEKNSDIDPKAIGEAWLQHYRKFFDIRQVAPQIKTTIIKYEDIVRNPRGALTKVSGSLEIALGDNILDRPEFGFESADVDSKQLVPLPQSQALETESIGVWKSVLDDSEIALFLDGCGGIEVYENRGYRLDK